jgi:bifunctional UDP-N-acetylglucosamine pyrophosphorylase/glucosamine-1-phosphate N-acetyltransferase
MSVIGLILAAGKGTRFKSEKPKVIHSLLGKPMVYFPYEALVKGLNPLKVGIIVGHRKKLVKEALKDLPKVEFFEQENPKGGTADAVLSAEDFLKEHLQDYVVILNGDSPLIKAETLKRGFEKLKENNLKGLIFTTFLDNPTGYGRILRDEKGYVKAIVEEKDATDEERKIKEINGGFYIFSVKHLLEALREIEPSPVSGELYLTDVIKVFYSKGWEIDTYQTDAEELLGVNDRVQFSKVEKLLLRRKIESLQREGVTIRLPETVYIDWDVRIGKDTEIEPHVVIKGNTRIGESCFIGAGSIIENSILEDNVKVLPYSYISDSILKRDSVAGHYARIRNESVIEPKAEIGNFVEVKKSTIGEGTKAKHLAYIGDATIGKNTNVGAGTVFANYDGKKKYQTFVGNNVFIGSNSLIIAPRKLEDRSFIAGGSVVNKDIPEGALAIGRAKLNIFKDKNPLLKKAKTFNPYRGRPRRKKYQFVYGNIFRNLQRERKIPNFRRKQRIYRQQLVNNIAPEI